MKGVTTAPQRVSVKNRPLAFTAAAFLSMLTLFLHVTFSIVSLLEVAMLTSKLGTTDLELTRVGLGTWAMGGGDWLFGWGPQDEGEAIGAITRAIELGINWIDTARIYGHGKSEDVVGKALKQISEKPVIATKFGRVFQDDGSISKIIKRDSIITECEDSLRRLGVETIDLYQMHWPEPDEDIEEAWQTMVDLKQQGKVRHIGVCNHNVEQLKRLQAIHPVASLQPPYSMITPEIEQEILPYCGEQNIGTVVYSPMCKGLLTGKFDKTRAEALPESDHRSRDPKFAEPQLTYNLQLSDGLAKIAKDHSRTVAELAIAWTLRRNDVTSAIVGARSPRQIEGTAAAADWQLDDATVTGIDALLADRIKQLKALGATDTGRV